MLRLLLTSTVVILVVYAVKCDAAIDICQQGPIIAGKANICKIATQWLYTYNAKSGVCEKFGYGGCFGSENLFPTVEECKSTCQTKTPRYVPSGQNGLVCNLPAETGPCEAYIPSYFFDKKTKQCRSFIYGGCGGNGNNFRTLRECRTACRA